MPETRTPNPMHVVPLMREVLAHVKSTKGTHVYGASSPSTAPVRMVYVQKEAIGEEPPPTIILTVEVLQPASQ